MILFSARIINKVTKIVINTIITIYPGKMICGQTNKELLPAIIK